MLEDSAYLLGSCLFNPLMDFTFSIIAEDGLRSGDGLREVFFEFVFGFLCIGLSLLETIIGAVVYGWIWSDRVTVVFSLHHGSMVKSGQIIAFDVVSRDGMDSPGLSLVVAAFVIVNLSLLFGILPIPCSVVFFVALLVFRCITQLLWVCIFGLIE